MTSKIYGKSINGDITLERLRKRVLGGAYVLLDSLTEGELEAMQTMLFNDEAEIVNSACKPFLVAKLEKIIIPLKLILLERPKTAAVCNITDRKSVV